MMVQAWCKIAGTVAVVIALTLSVVVHAAPASDDSATADLRAALRAPTGVCAEPNLDRQRLTPFYSENDAAPLWLKGGRLTRRASVLVRTLAAADEEGLSPGDYRIAAIESHLRAKTPTEQACLDLLLTAAFNSYAYDVHSGRDRPSVADPTWYFTPPVFDAVADLRTANSARAFTNLLESLPPPHAEYQRLRVALVRYRRMEQIGGWPAIPAGPALKPGGRHEQIRLLRSRLQIEGDLEPSASSSGDRFDAALAEAVRHFQRRNGLRSDGFVGPNTRAALNVPVQERIAEIRRTMERWRWLPRDFGEHYIFVNTAAFELAVIDHGKSTLAMRVIVGQPDQATPSFTAMLTSIIINPYWNVPMRIARDALLPRQQRNPGYFRARGYRVFNINGSRAEIDPSSIDWLHMQDGDFDFRLRQEPGPMNSMGRLAFYIPNPFDVFLHGTPENWLFERDTRTFSEGCVRIEHPIALALHLLRATPGWSRERIQREIDSMRHQTLRLPKRTPVYIVYLPTWVDEGGNVHFAKDVYQREEVLSMDYPSR